MSDQTCEWEFTVPPDVVDLDRLWNEAMRIPAIYSYAYFEKLYKHAPKTYDRIRKARLDAGCKVINWDYDPDGRYAKERQEQER